MSLILDSSATLARVFPEERTDAILRVFEEIAVHGAWVPELWLIEVANTLNVGIRRGRLTAQIRDGVLADLQDMPISVDIETRHHIWTRTLAIADRHRLTIYDATYLELALRRGLPLATLDKELRLAAEFEQVPLLGL